LSFIGRIWIASFTSFAVIPQQFDKPKAFQLNASGLPMLRIVIS